MTSRRDAELTALSSGVILQEPDDIVDLTLSWPDLPNEFLPYLNSPTLAELHVLSTSLDTCAGWPAVPSGANRAAVFRRWDSDYRRQHNRYDGFAARPQPRGVIVGQPGRNRSNRAADVFRCA